MDELTNSKIRVSIMGASYWVPAGYTIMNAMEYAGWRFTRGAGCRSGFCGACSTVFRREGDYKLRFALACQEAVEPGMVLVQLPFTPAPRVAYRLEEVNPDDNPVLAHYPETVRCVACNTCTKACPQDIEVMEVIQGLLRNDLEAVALGSFDCIQCGLCSMRCPADIKHYHLTQMTRRLYGRYRSPVPAHLEKRVEEIIQGVWDGVLNELVGQSEEEWVRAYAARDIEKEAEGR